jgi:SAM-dependent methyltransferase
VAEPAWQDAVSRTSYVDYDYDRFYTDHDFRYVERVEAAFLDVILRRLVRLPGGASVLDAGCGTGFDTWLMDRMGYEAVGVDTSPVAIEKAVSRTGLARFLCRDALAPPNELGGPFDLVYCSGFMPFNWVPSLQDRTALAAARALLQHSRPGGWLIFVWDSLLTGKRWSPYADVRPERMWMNYTLAQAGALWKAAGDCEIQLASVTHKRLAPWLGRMAFTPHVTAALSAAARTLRRPAQIVTIVRRNG